MPQDAKAKAVMASLKDSDDKAADTTGLSKINPSLPLKLRMTILANRKKDTTPIYTKGDSLRDAQMGGDYRGQSMDSTQIKMAHDQWLKHLDDMGYMVVKKQQ